MGFLIILLQSILKFDFIKASLAFAILNTGLTLLTGGSLGVAMVKLVIFVVISFLMDKSQDSIFKWLIVLLSAGLILG